MNKAQIEKRFLNKKLQQFTVLRIRVVVTVSQAVPLTDACAQYFIRL